MSNIPEGLHYTKNHEWAQVEGGLLVVGITDFAQKALGDVVYVDVKPAGTILSAGDSFGAIESVKAAEDLYAPVSGVIAEANAALNDNPARVNQNPYEAWMVKFKDYNVEELKALMDSAAYAAHAAASEE